MATLGDGSAGLTSNTMNIRNQWCCSEHACDVSHLQDKTNKGESGTLADAASPLSNPRIIYTGGANNGAASGILRSTDMGGTWQRASAKREATTPSCLRR